jgi:hypothetical protein
MRNVSRIVIGTGVMAGIVGVGLLVGWWGGRKPSPDTRPAGAEPAPADSSAGNHPLLVATGTPPLLNTAAGTNAPPQMTPVTPAPDAANAPAVWEAKVDLILGAETDDTNKVQQLFEIFPALPEDGQVEVAQHLSNLVSDEDYAPLGQLLQNAKLPESVLDVLLGDALNRPNAQKLPTLLEVARNPDHVEAGEAKDLLELYLDEDYGNNWEQWRQKLQEWLKENPD